MTNENQTLLIKALINWQFGYCPLVWMLHSRSKNNKIKITHKHTLKVVYDDKIFILKFARER